MDQPNSYIFYHDSSEEIPNHARHDLPDLGRQARTGRVWNSPAALSVCRGFTTPRCQIGRQLSAVLFVSGVCTTSRARYVQGCDWIFLEQLGLFFPPPASVRHARSRDSSFFFENAAVLIRLLGAFSKIVCTQFLLHNRRLLINIELLEYDYDVIMV